MKSSKNKIVLLVVCIAAIGGGLYFWRENGIRAGSSFRLRQLLNVHESPTKWLSVHGKKYENVRGIPPYYIDIPKLGLIFFVTSSERDAHFFYHFVGPKDGREIEIPAPYTYLGHGIGTAADSYRHDSVQTAEWPNVVIASRLFAETRRYKFDLEKQTVVEESVEGVKQGKAAEGQGASR